MELRRASNRLLGMVSAMNLPPEPSAPPLSRESFGDLVSAEVVRLGVESVLNQKREHWWVRLASHPLLNTIMQFVLIAGVGGWIAFRLQQVADQHKREAEIREVRRSGAEKVFRDVSASMDRRLFWSVRYHEALLTNSRPALESARAHMDSTIVEWYTTLNTNTAMLCMYFGTTFSDRFNNDVSRALRMYSENLNAFGTDPNTLRPVLAQERDHLEGSIYDLDLRLADAIRDGVPSIERGTADKCEQPENLISTTPVPVSPNAPTPVPRTRP